MSTPTGFMDYKRELPADRDPLERIKDWEEFHKHFSEDQLRTQGARCMDCGTPYCHTGIELPGGASGCPVNNLIPEWNNLYTAVCGVKRLTVCIKQTIFLSLQDASVRLLAKDHVRLV